MKKLLVTLPSLFLIFIIAGFTFKMQHWPGGSIFLLFGLFLSGILYLPLLFIQRIKENKNILTVITNLFGLISSVFIVFGVMFKIQHWPGASMMLIAGSTLLIVPTLILYVVQQLKNKVPFSEYFKMFVAVLCIGVFFLNIGTSVTRSVITSSTKTSFDLLNTNFFTNENNILLIDKLTKNGEPNLNKIHSSTTEMVTQIDEMKKTILSYSGESPESINNPYEINAKDQYDTPTGFLIEQENGKHLYESLIKYKKQLNKICIKHQLNNSVNEKIDRILNLEYQSNPGSGIDSWEKDLFLNTPLIMTFTLLTSIQNQLLMSENIILNEVAKKRNL